MSWIRSTSWKCCLLFLAWLCLLMVACGPSPTPNPPTQPPTDTAPPPSPTVRPSPTPEPTPTPQPTPLPTATESPAAPAMPDPKADPAAALRYTGFPAGLGTIGFTSTFRLEADPWKNWGYGMETAHSFGTLNVGDDLSGTIDMELHVTFTIDAYGQDMHVIATDDRAWVRWGGVQWLEIEADSLTSDDWERMVWGGWHPLNALEPFDSASEVEWVEDMLLDGEPTHQLHVVFDPEKMQHLAATAKARYEYQWYHLVGAEAGYGTPISADVQADVWLAAEDLAVRHIEMLIQIVTGDDSGGEQTTWTIARNVQFDAGAPSAIAEPVLDAAGAKTDCSQVTEITEAECRALVALYEGTGGEAWTDVEGWLAGNRPCTWGGVSCRGGHVLWLILLEAGLSGTLPPELGDLRWLQVLYMRDNDVRAPIPPALGALGDLQALDLSWNFELGGPVPAEIGSLRSLQELNLSLSGLMGPLPEGFKSLELSFMDLDGTGLCVPDDPAFRNWVERIGSLGTGVRYDGVDTIYCTQPLVPESTTTPEAGPETPSPAPSPTSGP